MRRVLWFAGAIALFVCGALLEWSGRLLRPQMQPKVAFVSDLGNMVSDLSEICPQISVIETYRGDNEIKVDYVVFVSWAKDHWDSRATRTDRAAITPDLANGDYKTILRRTCQAIMKYAPFWASDQLFRSQVVFSQYGRTDAPPSGGVQDSDPTRRYELTEYRHGSIVGVALVDTKLGRTWRLTDIVSKSKTRTLFEEVTVEGLWENNDDEVDRELKSNGDLNVIKQTERLDTVKSLTRPKSIQDAETEASRENP